MSTEREIRQSAHMTDTEALMWAMERDPQLSSGMGSVFVLDRPLDLGRLRSQMDDASRTFLRLRERVEEGLHLTTPRWVVDEDFDLDFHVVSRKLPAPGGMRELLDLAAEVLSLPFDRDRPLWQFVVVSGPGSDQADVVHGALIIKMHHSVSDGIGAVRLAEMYLDIERDPEERRTPTEPPEPPSMPEDTGIRGDLGHIARRQLGLARRVAGEVALWGVDRGRAKQSLDDLATSARSVIEQMGGSSEESDGGSPLWAIRSDRRRLEVLEIGLEDTRRAAKSFGGTVNDLFVTGSVMAAAAYHARRDIDVNRFNLSFILSTRSDHAAGGNSFAPVPFSVDATVRSAAATFAEVQEQLGRHREQAERASSELMELTAGVFSSLPAALLSRVGRARARRLDFATSNLRAAPFTLYIAGAEITHMYPVGPLVGTAWNLTAMSYDGTLYLGLYLDPEAVDSPAELRDDLIAAYRELLAAAPSDT